VKKLRLYLRIFVKRAIVLVMFEVQGQARKQSVRTIAQTTHYSDNPLFRQPITPTAHFFLY